MQVLFGGWGEPICLGTSQAASRWRVGSIHTNGVGVGHRPLKTRRHNEPTERALFLLSSAYAGENATFFLVRMGFGFKARGVESSIFGNIGKGHISSIVNATCSDMFQRFTMSMRVIWGSGPDQPDPRWPVGHEWVGYLGRYLVLLSVTPQEKGGFLGAGRGN